MTVMMNILLALVLLLCCVTELVYGECPPNGCGPYGVCHKDTRSCGDFDQCQTTCKCDIGYDGADCSLRAVTCPNDIGPNGLRTCFNGGTCAEREVYDDSMRNGAWSEWFCDCRGATGLAGNNKIHVGHQCEFPVQTSCIKGEQQSNYAFCVNNGACHSRVNPGEPHPGCLCVGGYGGRHCQYRKDTVPHDELVLEAYLDGQSDGGMGGFGIFIVVMLAAAFAAGMAYVVFESKTFKSKQADTNDPHDVGDLQLEEDPSGARPVTHNAEVL